MNERTPIPNINIGQVYDQRYSDAEVHYDKLGNLAGFFGRNMPVAPPRPLLSGALRQERHGAGVPG